MAELAAREVRCDLQVPVQIAWADDSKMALTENISQGGLFAATSNPGRVGDRVVLRFRLPDVHRWLVVQGEVRWIRANPVADVRHGARGMGIMLTSVSAAVAALVREFVGTRFP